MHTVSELQEIINKEITSLNFSKSPELLYKPIRYSMSMGGKRLRPVMMLMACEMFSGKYEKAIPSALAIEVFHNSTLLHDDIMDEADVRRNQPSVYKEWGRNVAILSGDAMIIKSYELLNKTPTKTLQKVCCVFNRIAMQVCEGQQYDMDFETSDDVGISDYMNMIRLKTSVLLAGSLEIGAIIGGADEINAKKIYSFGENLGLAFQLQDDLLDSYGDKATFGKKIGGDIVANKKTFLLLKALELAKGAYHDELTSLLANKKNSDKEKIEGVLNIYNKLGIKKIAEDYMLQYFDKAFECLETVDVKEDQKDALVQLSKKLIGRKS